ncbi:hypothetical protein D3C76_1674100 [compost metagenome]
MGARTKFGYQVTHIDSRAARNFSKHIPASVPTYVVESRADDMGSTLMRLDILVKLDRGCDGLVEPDLKDGQDLVVRQADAQL